MRRRQRRGRLWRSPPAASPRPLVRPCLAATNGRKPASLPSCLAARPPGLGVPEGGLLPMSRDLLRREENKTCQDMIEVHEQAPRLDTDMPLEQDACVLPLDGVRAMALRPRPKATRERGAGAGQGGQDKQQGYRRGRCWSSGSRPGMPMPCLSQMPAKHDRGQSSHPDSDLRFLMALDGLESLLPGGAPHAMQWLRALCGAAPSPSSPCVLLRAKEYSKVLL